MLKDDTNSRLDALAAKLDFLGDILAKVSEDLATLLPKRKPTGAEVPPDPDHVETPPAYRGGPREG